MTSSRDVSTAGCNLEDDLGRRYVDERGIPRLFKAITIGLVHGRPRDIVTFIQECLEKARDIPHDQIAWDTFLEPDRPPSSSVRLTPLPGSPTDIQEGQTTVVNEKAEVTAKAKPKNDTKGKKKNAGGKGNKKVQTQQTNGNKGKSKKKAGKMGGGAKQNDQVTKNGDESENDDDIIAEEEEAEEEEKHVWELLPEYMQRVLRGGMEDLPPMPSSIVRIFLSSTFSDFKAERNILPKKAYPALQKFCNDRGLDFQVLDMRWGVTDDVMNDHQVSQLCLREIKTCQQLSCGPNFVTLVGLRYGWQPFPTVIEVTEFEYLSQLANELSLEHRELLQEWFRRDDNAIPAVYVLQKIGSKLSFYGDMRPEVQDKREKEKAEWNLIFDRIRNVLRTAVIAAFDRGQIDEAAKAKYFISVTEEEIQEGLLKPDSVNKQAICYMRSLEGIETDGPVGEKLPKFVDTDDVAVQLRKELVEEKIPKKISHGNIQQYTVPWTGVPLEESEHDAHRDYLETFADNFIKDIERLVRARLESGMLTGRLIRDEFYYEVLHHLKFGKRKCEIFCGREDAIRSVVKYIKIQDETKHPLVIHGQSGYGKTSFLSHIASQAKELIGKDCFTVLRLMGTSPESTTIHGVLKSVIGQISLYFGYQVPTGEDLDTMGEVRLRFRDLLHKIKRFHRDTPVLIILDSVDQLALSYGAHELHWLPRSIPGNIHLIVSMLSDRFTCLENARLRITNEKAFVELDPIPLGTGKDIMYSILSKNQRTLTDEQKLIITNAFALCAQPLFLKLVMDEALTWQSYAKAEDLKMCHSVRDAIRLFFEKLEFKYGHLFTSRALAFLTCGQGGLSSIEIEDALSCDDAVLNEVYQYHDPPLEGTVRVPSLMWARLQSDASEYLVERQVAGKNVLTWHHRQFLEGAENWYLKEDRAKKHCHTILAELFGQENGIKKTITLIKRRGKVIEDADRRVTPQPLSVRNQRKLSALPYHLRLSGQVDELKKICLLNFNWLWLKLHAFAANKVALEFEEVCSDQRLCNDVEVLLIKDFLQMSHDAIMRDANMLAHEVVGRLKTSKLETPSIKRFIADAEAWIKETKIPHLQPTHDIQLMDIDCPQTYSAMAGYTGKLSKSEKEVVCQLMEANSNVAHMKVLSLTERDTIAFHLINKVTQFGLTPDDRNYIFLEDKKVVIKEIKTGETVKVKEYREQEYDKVTTRCLAINTAGSKLVAGNRYGKPKDSDDKMWRTTVHIVLIDITGTDPTVSVRWHGKKPVDNLIFFNDDKHIFGTSKDGLFIYDANDLSLVHSVEHLQDIAGETFSHVPGSGKIVGATCHKQGTKTNIVIMDVGNFETELSQPVEPKYEGKVKPFALAVSSDLSKIAVGVKEEKAEEATDEQIRFRIIEWERTQNTYTSIHLVSHRWKEPKSMAVGMHWTLGVVGWEWGNITLVDMQKGQETSLLKGHSHMVNEIVFFNQGQSLLTIGQDHYLHVWNTSRLYNIMRSSQGEPSASDITQEKYERLDRDEQCVDLCVTDDFLISAQPNTEAGPRLWRLDDGSLLKEKSNDLERVFLNWYKKNGAGFPLRSHGSVQMLDTNTLAYMRKIRDGIAMHVYQDIHSDASNHGLKKRDVFNCQVTNKYRPADEGAKYHMIVRTTAELLIYSVPDLTLVSSAELPPITNDIFNVQSSGGKKKLSFMKYGITTNGKYYVILNPSPSGGAEKFFDLVDLLEGKYLKRVIISRYTPWRLMACGLTYLVTFSEEEGPAGVFMASLLDSFKGNVHSTVPIESDTSFTEDLTMGTEITKYHRIYIWKLDPFGKLHDMEGHALEVTATHFTKDNCYLVSGSYDRTVRIWSVETGEQVTLYHLPDSVIAAVPSPSLTHIAVHCSASPQRRRAIILKVKNFPENENTEVLTK